MNAKQEFEAMIHHREVLCASIIYSKYVISTHSTISSSKHILRENYTKNEFKEFLDSLNFEYDNGHSSSQQLFGTVWFSDGTWGTREEYDGSENWYIHELPKIPEELRR
jgi:hypothetical protein